MTVHSGHLGSVTSGGTEVGELRSFNLTHTVRDQDASVMGVGYTKNTAGQETLEGTVEVYHDHGDAAQTAMTVGSTFAGVFYPTGDTTAHETVSATMRVMSIARSAAHDGNVTRTYNVKSISAVTIGVVS